MAAPAESRALTVGTPEFAALFLTCSVLEQNGGGGVAIQEARKEWHLLEEVINPADIQNGDSRIEAMVHTAP